MSVSLQHAQLDRRPLLQRHASDLLHQVGRGSSPLTVWVTLACIFAAPSGPGEGVGVGVGQSWALLQAKEASDP